jgi:16S rRNA (cytosine1402-N4)-methyltransferase
MNIIHQPVLVKKIIENLPEKLNYFYDWTLGHWGHARQILKVKAWKIKKYIGVDRDKVILEKAKENLKEFGDKVVFILGTYDESLQVYKFASWQVYKFKQNPYLLYDWILLDLGVNIEHFKDPRRWFSIKQNWPLDMRFDINQNFTAKDLINTYNVWQFIEIFSKYWDFSPKFAEKIWETIIRERRKRKIETTFDLKEVLKTIWLNERKISVAFQCIRIQVNKELEYLEKFLEKFWQFLEKGWRCFIITYHSIEDRIVKNKFRQLKDKWICKLLNKHVIKPSWEEIKQNRAARSAKLRIIEKI